VSTSRPGDDIPETVDEALRDALDADLTGELRERVRDLAAAAFRMSCGPEADAAPLQRLALTLRRTVLRGPGPTPRRAVPAAEAPSPGGAGLPPRTQETRPGPGIPARLAQARDEVREVTENRLRVVADEPRELWRQLHLGTLWIGDSMRTRALEALGGKAPEYLIPPLDEVAEDGITWAAAEADQDVAAALARWPLELREAADQLAPVIGLILTVANLAAGLFTVGGRPAAVISPIVTSDDRSAYRQRVLGTLERIAESAGDPSVPVDWLGALDEALRSVFPLPVPSRYSLWAGRLETSRGALATHAHKVSPDAVVVLLDGVRRYEDAQRKQFAPDDGNIAIQPFTDLERYEVLWPLRAYVELPGSDTASRIVRTARVLYGHEGGFDYRKL
jgi:hypothetical protein